MSQVCSVPVESSQAAPTQTKRWSKARSWISKGAFAITDQGLISGSNFILGILLARWMGATQYGAYALAFAIFLLLSLVYQSLILEPMSVFGPSVYRESLRQYTGAMIWAHLALGALTSAALAITAIVMRGQPRFGELPHALLGTAFAAPCVLLFWLARRAYYLRLMSGQAATGAIVYSVLLFAGLFAAQERGLMSPAVAFVIMGLAALGTSALLLARFRPQVRLNADPPLKLVMKQNWQYGKWALASALFMWLPWNIFYTLLASFSGMAQAGNLRALMNFHLPMLQTFAAFSLLFLPHAAYSLETNGWRAVEKFAWQISLFFLAGGLVYWSLIVVFRTQVITTLYKGHYSEITPYIPWIGLASILWCGTQGLAISLRSIKSPSGVFYLYVATSIVAVAVGIPGTFFFGLAGAIAAMIAASVGAFAVCVFLMRRETTRDVNVPVLASADLRSI